MFEDNQARKMSNTDEMSSILDIGVTKEWLLQQLRTDSKRLILLDCRTSSEFQDSHVRQSVNLSIPSIMLRRLAAGKISLLSTIKCRELKERIVEGFYKDVFVLYGDEDVNDWEKNTGTNEVLHVLLKRLRNDGCQVVRLEEGYSAFRISYPEWCESSTEVATVHGPDAVSAPLMGLRSLRISASPPTTYRERYRLPGSSCGSSAPTSSTDSSDEDRCDSSLGLEDDKDFPVEILPYLYLGNAANSEDSESLSRHNIQYILNVTADLANVFEDCGSMKYMQIPIADHWSQNLARFFPKAIRFIDEGRDMRKGVLVHCLAGVSRSVTITVAYLMFKLNLGLNDAFNMVRDRKANIAPNFHFMEQLHNFEQELKAHPSLPDWKDDDEEDMGPTTTLPSSGDSSHLRRCPRCDPGSACLCKSRTGVQFLSPLAIGTSPDSGIEFDRWVAPPGPGD